MGERMTIGRWERQGAHGRFVMRFNKGKHRKTMVTVERHPQYDGFRIITIGSDGLMDQYGATTLTAVLMGIGITDLKQGEMIDAQG